MAKRRRPDEALAARWAGYDPAEWFLARFCSKFRVDEETGCWVWYGPRHTQGYGLFSSGTVRNLRAHRTSYELFIGPIPYGLVIDHLCRNTSCVNPDHLEPVTTAENNRRREQDFCHLGHPYSGTNEVRTAKRRYCLECKRLRAVRFASRHRHPSLKRLIGGDRVA